MPAEADMGRFKWPKGRPKPERPKAATCPACHLITDTRHCPSSPTCNWFLCEQHAAVTGVIGPGRTLWVKKPKQP